MTRDDILRMAREVADKNKVDPISGQPGEEFVTMTPEELERFAALVAAEEREQCAKGCDEAAGNLLMHRDKDGAELAISLRDSIRARGTK